MPGRVLRSLWTRRLALALGALLVTLAALEGGARLLGPFEGPRFPLETRSAKGLGRYDPLLFWSLRPDALGDDGLTRTNALGLRGPQVPAVKGDEHRILVLGESTTFGWDVPEDAIYTTLLQKAFDARPSGRRPVRVVNAGVPGYTSFQGLQYLRARGLDLEPDTVVFVFGINDFLPVSYLDLRMGAEDASARGLDDGELFEHRARWTFRARAWLLERSEFARALFALDGGDVDDTRAAVRTDPSRPRVPEALRRRVLDELAELCHAHGLRLVLVVPWYRSFRDHGALLRRFAIEHEVPFVDLTRLAAAPDAPSCFLDVVHPNAEGHRRMAEALLPTLAAGVD
ncbi:MAG: hypothetical protein H6825_07390 [Planctomycetes bacterium]|nr:hypothetical protein [Planctomycetota bacterium]